MDHDHVLSHPISFTLTNPTLSSSADKGGQGASRGGKRTMMSRCHSSISTRDLEEENRAFDQKDNMQAEE